MTHPPQLDIVIPVFNEGNNITRILNALHAHIQRTTYRVLICYDFDEDTTLQALAAYDNPGVEVVLVRNPSRGPHAAVMAGFAASTAPGVLVYPADDDYNPPIVDDMVAAMNEGCQIVSASRFIPGGNMVNAPLMKNILVRLSSWALHHVAGVPAHDASNGLRLFSRRVIDDIIIESDEGFTFSIELLMKTHRLGWPICEVPAQWYEREKGEGTSNFKLMAWLPSYLTWFYYAFATTYLRRSPQTVPVRSPAKGATADRSLTATDSR